MSEVTVTDIPCMSKAEAEAFNQQQVDKGYNHKIINVDTDAILICKPDGSDWTKDEQNLFIQELNAQFPDKINFDHDGYYESVLVIASKNYALLEKGSTKVKTKGSSIRDQKKEPALREMINKIIDAFIFDKQDEVPAIYESYVKEVMNITDISRWAQKKGVTEAITNCEGYEKYSKEELKAKGIRANETNVWDAIKHEEIIQQGDKFMLYPGVLGFEDITTSKTLKSGVVKETTKRTYTYGLQQVKLWDAKNPNHDKEQLLQRVYKTLEIFETILDLNQFTNYSLVKNYKLLVGEETKHPATPVEWTDEQRIGVNREIKKD